MRREWTPEESLAGWALLEATGRWWGTRPARRGRIVREGAVTRLARGSGQPSHRPPDSSAPTLRVVARLGAPGLGGGAGGAPRPGRRPLPAGAPPGAPERTGAGTPGGAAPEPRG